MNSITVMLIGAASLALAGGASAQSSIVAPSGNTPPSAIPLSRPYPNPVPAQVPQGAVVEDGNAALIDPPVDLNALDRPIFIPQGRQFSGSSSEPIKPPLPSIKPAR